MLGEFPLKKIAPPRLELEFALALGLGLELGGNCPRTILPMEKKGDFLHANEMLVFIHLLYVQSCTFL